MSFSPTPAAALASGLAAVAMWIAGARVGRARVRDITGAGPEAADAAGSSVPAALAARLRSPATRTVGVTLAVAVSLAVIARSPVPLLLGGPAAVFLARRGARSQARRDAERLRGGAAELASVMVGELRAGQQPCEAFAVAAAALDGPIRIRLADAVAVAEAGGDVPAALVRAAAPPGADGLARIAACWSVAAERGAGFATALHRVSAGLRAEEAGLREVEAELAGARSTARLLAGLPLFGILLGHGVGADPLRLLLHTPLGALSLASGLALVAAGLTWTDRLAHRGLAGGAP